jgi:hypothetical protein
VDLRKQRPYFSCLFFIGGKIPQESALQVGGHQPELRSQGVVGVFDPPVSIEKKEPIRNIFNQTSVEIVILPEQKRGIRQ